METKRALLRNETQPLFSQRDLLRLILPLGIDSLLNMSVGFIGTIMVASAGEEAVSGVSLVDNVNLFILVFVQALATGGAIVVAQYLGKGQPGDARNAAKQLLYATLFTSLILTTVSLLGNRLILSAVFGNVEPLVMQYARTYFFITALSYPFTAIISACAAVFRSMGISKTPMLVTLLLSIVNVVCCITLIYGFGMGVTGAAVAALVSRVAACTVILLLIRNHQNVIYLDNLLKIRINFSTIKSILRVGVPSGIDSGMFLLGKLLVQSLIATFGTISIASNAVTGQVLNIIFIPGGAIQMAVITVIGQCVGAGDYPQAVSNAKRLLRYSYTATAAMCAAVFLFKMPILSIFNLSPEAVELSVTVLTFSCLTVALLHPLSFVTPNILRAAGDVRYTMVVSVISMWTIRILMSYVIEYSFKLGLMSIFFAMYADWLVRGTFYLWRFASGRWKSKRVV